MVLLAAAVCTKVGKALISRQFVEMTKVRIEGLLAAFPKLMGSGKQHTFVETESVRYVYQPLDKLYVLLITTKTSNILEDLETLRLFSRVIPEYCKSMDESDILENAFNLIFAFDEIVALGYRESVNLAQIRSFVEMDSHEEKVYQAVRQTQERDAKNKMREKAKEFAKLKQDNIRKGIGKSSSYGSGFGSSSVSSSGGGGGSNFTNSSSYNDNLNSGEPVKPAYNPPSKSITSSKAMKLGSKGRDMDNFVDQLKSEGEVVSSPIQKQTGGGVISKMAPKMNTEPFHVRIEEKVQLVARRDGGLQSMELHGQITFNISEPCDGFVKVLLDYSEEKTLQFQCHPNIDKDLFKNNRIVALKNSTKPFPLNTDVGVLKWRFQTTDESFIPLNINCWPSENGSGGCDVNIEYELEQPDFELNDVVITVPTPGGSIVVNECTGDYKHDKHRFLEWTLPIIDSSNKSGTLEFSAGGHPPDFFPITVSFYSEKTFFDCKIAEVMSTQADGPVKHSIETSFVVDKYEIV